MVQAAVHGRSLQGQPARDSTRGTRIIITAARGGHTQLSDRIAESLTVILRRRFRCTELEILTQRDADRASLIEPPRDRGATSIDDLREVAKTMATDVVIDLRVNQRGRADIDLTSVVVDRRTGTVRPFATIRKPSVSETPRQLMTRVAADTSFRRRYPLRPIDRAARQLTCAAPERR